MGELNRRDFLKISSGLVAGAALAGYGGRLVSLKNKLEALPDPATGAQNVIFIVLDTFRAQSMSLLGYDRPTTPQLERIARRGVSFKNAISTSSWTLPSHASMFTGYYPRQLTADWWIPYNGAKQTLAEVFRDSGYFTAGFVANFYYLGYEYGMDRGFLHYQDYRLTPGEAIYHASVPHLFFNEKTAGRRLRRYNNFGRKSAGQLRLDTIRWLSENRSERPFFAFLNFFDAHDPYLPPKPFATNTKVAKVPGFLSYSFYEKIRPEVLVELQTMYEGAISYVDEQIGLLFDELEQQGLLGNSVIIITSDHGEHFGENSLIWHGNSVYIPLLHVPLLIIHPGKIPQNLIVEQAVSLRDLAATIVDLSGINTPVNIPGQSMSQYWEGNPIDQMNRSELITASHNPTRAKIGVGPFWSLIYQNMHYISNPNKSEELYDLKVDPLETTNLISLSEYSELVKDFRASL
jgi:arylsulfatase A-like enzyme